MRNRGLIGAVVALAGLQSVPVSASENRAQIVEGVVVDSRSRWGYGGDLIVTETTVETRTGERVVLHQLGGQVGDVATVVTHAPRPLPMYAWVSVDAVSARAATGRRWMRVDRVHAITPALAPGALGFVVATNENNVGLFFESSCALVGVNEGGSTTIPDELELTAIDRTIGRWNDALGQCSYLSIERLDTIPIDPGFDGINVIQFREDRWCRPAAGDDPEVCHDPAAAALTFLTFGLSGDRDGAILDADIEINGVDFGLVVDGMGRTSAGCVADLENTLTHELGHLIGLDHTCYDGIGTRPVDGDGNPLPSCFPEGNLEAAVIDATMYNFQDCGETKKISLESDDVAGACAIYPAGESPGECTHPSVFSGLGFCSTGGGGSSWLVALVLLAIFRRRSREAPRG